MSFKIVKIESKPKPKTLADVDDNLNSLCLQGNNKDICVRNRERKRVYDTNNLFMDCSPECYKLCDINGKILFDTDDTIKLIQRSSFKDLVVYKDPYEGMYFKYKENLYNIPEGINNPIPYVFFYNFNNYYLANERWYTTNLKIQL